MGADLFGSFAESTCAALVISSVSTLGTEHVYVAMCYPLLISAVGILVCLLTTLIATDLKPARGINDIQSTLKWQLVIATVLATPVSVLQCLRSMLAFDACVQCLRSMLAFQCLPVVLPSGFSSVLFSMLMHVRHLLQPPGSVSLHALFKPLPEHH